MFTYSRWHKFCSRVCEVSNVIKAEELIGNESLSSWVVVKHDVEVKPKKALRLAEIESLYGIKATYYFQADLIKDNMTILKKIAELGHEVSYHYDVLDSCRGDFELAEQEFNFYLQMLRANGFAVRTVCPHGNPVLERSGWNSNKDFFRNQSVAERHQDILDIVVHNNRINPKGFTYVSDAGYNWNIVVNVESNDIIDKPNIALNSIEQVLEVIKTNPRVIISTHPHRWGSNDFTNRLSRAPFFIIKLILKPILRFKLVRVFLSPFYSIAKRF